MTTELVLLIAIFVFVISKAFFGQHGPFQTFEKSGPRLGARLEQQLNTGGRFNGKGGAPPSWEMPDKAPPTGQW